MKVGLAVFGMSSGAAIALVTLSIFTSGTVQADPCVAMLWRRRSAGGSHE